MKMEGGAKLKRTMRKMPESVHVEIFKAVVKNVNEGVKIAKTLAPDVTGETKANIRPKYELKDGYAVGSIEAAEAEKDEQIRANAIEFGRKTATGGKGVSHPFIRPTQEYLEKRFRGRISRAINKAMKAASRG